MISQLHAESYPPVPDTVPEPAESESTSQRLLLPALSALRLVGALAVEFAVLWRFGIGPITDAYFAAVAIPWVLSRASAAAAPAALVAPLRKHFDEGHSASKAIVKLGIVFALAAAAISLAAHFAISWVSSPRGSLGLVAALCIAHAISTLSEIVKPAFIAMGRPVISLGSDGWQALAAVTLIAAAPAGTSITEIGWLIALSYGVQAVVLIARLSVPDPARRTKPDPSHADSSSRPEVGSVTLWLECRRSFLLTSGSTAARRVTVPVERNLALLGMAGGTSSIAYAGQLTNALAAVMGAGTTNWLLPAVAQSRADMMRQRTLVARTCLWLAASGTFVATGVAVAVIASMTIEGAADALGKYASVASTVGITILALPGMLVVQALLTVHYANGDGVAPSRHLLVTLAAHLLLLATLGSTLGLIGIAACWPLSGIYSTVRAYRITRPLLGGSVFTADDFRMLARSGFVALALQVITVWLGGRQFGLIGAGLAALISTCAAVLIFHHAPKPMDPLRGDQQG